MNQTSDTQTMNAARAFIRAEAAAVEQVANDLGQSFDRSATLIHACEGKVIVSGSGTSGAVARRMAHLLSVCGTPAVFIHPMDALHGTLGAVTTGDVFIAISKGGNTEELTECARRARSRGATVIAVTAAEQAPLHGHSDLVAHVSSSEADPEGIVAMGSTLATSAWGDALALEVMRRRQYSWEDVLFTHPAGDVGHNATALLTSTHARREERAKTI